MLLSNKIVTKARKAQEQPQEREDPDGFKSFGFFALAAFGERSPTGCWYQLISPTKDVRLQLHFLADKRIALKDLVGYDNTGNVRLWPSEECLAEYLLLNEEICRDKRVLELGAGMTGLAGLMALTAGAKTIYLTDGNERSVENLQMIVEKNSLNLGVKCAILEWAGERLSEKFDLVICADCLFFTNSHEALLGCIHAHLVDGGTAYLMAPSRRGTATQFLNQIYEERERWKSVQVRLLAAVHFACMQLADEVAEEVQAEHGTNLEFEGCVISQVAHLVTDALCDTWPNDLLLFAKHGKRSIVNANDVKLLVRKNESLVKFIEEELEKPSSTRRQKSSTRRCSEAISDTKKDNSSGAKAFKEKSSGGRRGRPSKTTSNANSDVNISKITNFLANDSEPVAGPSGINGSVSINEQAEDECSRSSVVDGVCLPANATYGRKVDLSDKPSGISEESPVGGVDSIDFDDAASSVVIESDSNSAQASEQAIEMELRVQGNERRFEQWPEIQEKDEGKKTCKNKPRVKRKAEGANAGARKRKISKQCAMASTCNRLETDEESMRNGGVSEILEKDKQRVEVVFNSLVNKPARDAKPAITEAINSGMKISVGKGTMGQDDLSTRAGEQRICSVDCGETLNGF
ncbi:unnamed protein product [Toxocara canis]|uniref:Calmodulin-lysine N-methyltransferase n=1 Tax=Toxocara canis TaxID=6265 RepID=A0A183VAF3_TOXCA|nr:unnamed protein product [Toxocara canis]